MTRTLYHSVPNSQQVKTSQLLYVGHVAWGQWSYYVIQIMMWFSGFLCQKCPEHCEERNTAAGPELSNWKVKSSPRMDADHNPVTLLWGSSSLSFREGLLSQPLHALKWCSMSESGNKAWICPSSLIVPLFPPQLATEKAFLSHPVPPSALSFYCNDRHCMWRASTMCRGCVVWGGGSDKKK